MSKLRSRLREEHLENELTVSSYNIKVDICVLMKGRECVILRKWGAV
jgi:hypothetical protein